MKSLPHHFQLRALTADYVVALFQHFTQTLANEKAAGNPLPAPPNHLDATMAADCRAVAQVLGQAVSKKCLSSFLPWFRWEVLTLAPDQLKWDAHQYADDAPKVSPYRAQREDRLLHLYPPLIPAAEVIGRTEPLPVIDRPAIIVDKSGNALMWSLPGIIPQHRQVGHDSLDMF